MKDEPVDNDGQRAFHFRDRDRDIIGIDDRAALEAIELGNYS